MAIKVTKKAWTLSSEDIYVEVDKIDEEFKLGNGYSDIALTTEEAYELIEALQSAIDFNEED